MTFEEARFRSTQEPIRYDEIVAHLSGLSWVFLDPVTKKIWHMSSSKAMADQRKSERLVRTDEFGTGILIEIRENEIILSQKAGKPALSQAKQFVQWLMKQYKLRVVVDFAPPVDLVAIDQLYRNIPNPDFYTLDGSVDWGTRVEWWKGNDETGGTHVLAIHTSGQLKYTFNDITIRGCLNKEALNDWCKAFEAIDEDEELDDIAPIEYHMTLFITDSDDDYSIDLDSREIPPSFQDLGKMMMGWIERLSENDKQPIKGLQLY